jgi:8-oxo-dGTP diphosphatase
VTTAADGMRHQTRAPPRSAMMAPMADPDQTEIPRVPASAGALIFDASGRLLILKPNYKKGWTIPGGQMEANGESPWEACQRETLEECGIAVSSGRLACVDFLRPKKRRPGGMRFLFDCGTLDADVLQGIVIDPAEIVEHRLVTLEEALDLLSGPVRRRVAAGVGSRHCVYLEEGQPVAGVSSQPPTADQRPE